jgi:hypothetical protein
MKQVFMELMVLCIIKAALREPQWDYDRRESRRPFKGYGVS